MRRILTILALVAALPVTAHAEPEPKGKTDVGQYVDLQPVALPIVSNGKLVNYVFVSLRLNLASSANAQKLREKEPFFRDALVRAAHRTPFNTATDLQSVDVGRLTASVMRDAATIAGPGAVRSVAVTSQAPRAHIRPPQLAAQ
jgi:flagellar basal body-associated protein FliL